MSGRRAAFLDRDGVINRDVGYLYEVVRFELIHGAVAGMRRLQEAGYLLVVVTNQSGIGRGYYDEAAFRTLTHHIDSVLSGHGIALAATYHCPHAPDDPAGCNCRKPKPGMIDRAVADLDIDPQGSLIVGDKISDVAAGRAAGLGACFLVGAASVSPAGDATPDGVFADLEACASWIVDRDRAVSDR